MKIALIIPRSGPANESSFYDYKFYSTFLLSNKYLSYFLAIPILASLTPPKHDIRIFDENIEDIDYEWKADIAGISVRTMCADRAYMISETYLKKGVKTVLGGIHPSMCPDEALQHCDTIVIGEAEEIWSRLLRDVEDGNLQKIYKSDNFADLTRSPIPDRSVLSDRYLHDIVQTAKGCPFNCEFCTVHTFDGQKIRTKTVDQVIREIQNINNRSSASYKTKRSVFFVDDNIIADKHFAMELFNALKPCNINWMCQASINISEDDELLRSMRESGCGAIFIGLESLSKDNLESMHKKLNCRYDYRTSISTIQSYGILVHGSFILGYDSDCATSFDDLVNFIQDTNLLMPLINILTPFPGTKVFKRMEAERRLLHKNWSKYDSKHVVFKPAHMSPEELFDGYVHVVNSVYSFESIYKKLIYYWDIDFWKYSNTQDPVKLKYRLLFAIRLCSLLISKNRARSRFIMKILPRVFDSRVRVSTILALMAFNDFADSLGNGQSCS